MSNGYVGGSSSLGFSVSPWTLSNFMGQEGDNTVHTSSHIPPIWSIDYNNQKELFKWAINSYNQVLERNNIRTLTLLELEALYKGNPVGPQGIGGDGLGSSDTTINFTKKTIDENVSRTASTEQKATVVPSTNEHSDKEGAKVAEKVLETIKYQQKLSAKFTSRIRRARVQGEGLMWIEWDPEAGDIDPEWRKLKTKYDKGDIKKGKVGKKGETRYFDPEDPWRIGEICIDAVENWEVFFEPAIHSYDVNWVMRRHWIKEEEAKKRWPSKEKELESSDQGFVAYDDANITLPNDKRVLVVECYVKSQKYLDEGLYFCFTSNTILEMPKPNPLPRNDDSEFGNLPIERLTDRDIPSEFHGYPLAMDLAPLQYKMDQMFSAAFTSFLAGSWPMLMVPQQGRINTSDFDNGRMLVSYIAPYKPEIAVHRTVSNDFFALLPELEKSFSVVSGNSGLQANELGSNVRSAEMISLLREEEVLRASVPIKKFQDFILAVNRKILSIVGKYYPEHPERMVRIIGRDKKYMIESVNTSVLNKPYDVRIALGSSLPTAPSAKLQFLMQIQQVPKLAELIDEKLFVDAMDLGEPGKVYNAVTAALNKAEQENEEFGDGKAPPLPTKEDDHITHWKTHNIIGESPAFQTFSPEIQRIYRGHQMTHEKMIFDIMATNPFFGEKVATLEGFPKYYKPIASPPTAVQPQPGQQNPVEAEEEQPQAA